SQLESVGIFLYTNHEDSRTRAFPREYSMDLQAYIGSFGLASRPNFQGNMFCVELCQLKGSTQGYGLSYDAS
ncbi:MAG: hypothetical protein ACYCV0_12225, partial [Desulfitobacteriaceae bacterium]